MNKTIALLISAGLSTVLLAVTLTNAQGNAKAPFTGTWDTAAAGTRFTVKLTQVGNKVTGTYSPYRGKIFDGVVTGKKLTFKWTQDGGHTGTGEFTLKPDGKGFTGSSTMVGREPPKISWNTIDPVDPGPPVSFAGSWSTDYDGGKRVDLTILQKGDKVVGEYPKLNGTLEGTVVGNILRFKWESDLGSGSGHFKLTKKGTSFAGFFNKGDDPDAEETHWNGGRPCIYRGDCDTASRSGPYEKTMASFEGLWQVNAGVASGILSIIVSGNNITGFYSTGGGSFQLNELRFKENTFRFNVIGRDPRNPVEPAALQLSQDGRSFTGTIGRYPAHGIFIRPN